MPEKLSQAQIDALLNRMSSGEEIEDTSDSKKKVKEYDFTSPKKFTKEQLKAMDGLHENFSRLLSSYFSGALRMFCEVSVMQIEEQRYFEYSNALPDSAFIGLIDFKPGAKRYSEGTLLMDMSTALCYSMVDRLLGGSGEGYNLARDFSDIEIALLQKVMGSIVETLCDAWHNYVDVDIALSSIETNSRLLQVLSPEDIVVIIVLGVKLRNLQGNLNICIPASNLEEVIDNFSLKYARSVKRQDAETEATKRQLIYDELNDSDLVIKAVLDEFQLDLRDILNLQVSDVIPIGKSIESDIKIMIDDMPWFYAKLGELRNKRAVKLNDLIT